MATDINKSFGVSFTADLSGLMSEIKKIPGISEKEAKAMTQAMSKHLKQTEAAAKKAAKTSEKSFDKMGKSAKKAGNEYRKLKRNASEMGRGFGEIALLVGESDSAIGSMAGSAAGFAMTASALTPMLGALTSSIKMMGLVAGGAATLGIGALVAGIAMLVSEQSKAEKEAERNRAQVIELNKAYQKYTDIIEKAEERSKQLKIQIIDATEAIEALKDEVALEQLRIEAEIDPKMVKDLEGLEEKLAFKQIARRVKNEFDKVNSTISESLNNQIDLTEAARKRANTVLSGPFTSEAIRRVLQVVTPDDFATLKNYIDRVKAGQTVIAKIGNSNIMLTDKELAGTKRLLDALETYTDANTELKRIEGERLRFQKERKQEEENLRESLEITFLAQREANKQKEAGNRASKSSNKTDERGLELSRAKAEFIAIESRLKMESLSGDEKKLLAIDQQLIKLIELQTITEKNAKDEKDIINISEVVNSLIGQRLQLEKEIESTRNERKRKEDAEDEIKVLRELFDSQKLGFEELNDLRFKYQGSFLETEQKIHAEIMRMIEERNQKTKEGLVFLTKSTGDFGKAMITTLQNVGSENQELIAGLFLLQQAASAGQIAMTTAENITKAQGFPPPLNIAGIAAAVAVGAAQTAAVMSQSPPKKHMGGMLAPDEMGNVTLLKGEAVLDRSTVRNLGGESGVRRLQENRAAPEVVVLQPFKHFDRYLTGRNKRQKKSANRGY
tara:strand:- start:2074 stop:4266 length:2193 start_codon:yes stop_codon:yes gene_type:complete